MKKFYTIMLAVLLGGIAAQAQETDYQPLVREGVVWHWSWDEVDDQLDKDASLYFNRRLYDFNIEFRGDTVNSGITYKKCYMY